MWSVKGAMWSVKAKPCVYVGLLLVLPIIFEALPNPRQYPGAQARWSRAAAREFPLLYGRIANKFRVQTAREPLYPATCWDYFNVTATG
jgi:hypothetical protein